MRYYIVYTVYIVYILYILYNYYNQRIGGTLEQFAVVARS